MTTSLFNTPAETATRLTMCLSRAPRPLSLDETTALDLAATYMKQLGFGNESLHGDTPYAAAEYDARRRRIHAGLARLVRTGMASTGDNGITFGSTLAGQSFAQSLDGAYADAYGQAVVQLLALGLDVVVGQVQKKVLQHG
ncbi:ABC-three component system middle component 2 [Corynebacterium vitaeruminis]|nr:ABC-three component system middle component 2 [Corynebacterium vitaeruminis]